MSRREKTEVANNKDFGGSPRVTRPTVPKRRQELLKWNGWGYKDSRFTAIEQNAQRKIKVKFTGTRYPISNKVLPHFAEFAEKQFGAPPEILISPQPEIKDENIPKPTINEEFMADFKELGIDFSLNPQDRLFRAHGHTMREIFTLRTSFIEKVPDLVVWPSSHDDVVHIVQLAVKHNVAIIPFGGGTSVSGAVECPLTETRMIISLDTSQMNRILWVNKSNCTALIESGIIGQDLDAELAKYGMCTGHEPDSGEFSSLGGWVATRASGMKKTVYGNIEDMVVHVRMVTPQGEVRKNCLVPRISSGPDIHQFILGSEGTLGVITEVVLRLRPIPPYKKYGSIVFPSFESGVECLKEVVRQQLKPASMRLMDNLQFTFGQALKPETSGRLESLGDFLKKFYVTKVKGIDLQKISIATLLMEGNEKEVKELERKIYAISEKYGGFTAGEDNGKRGYMLTYVIAYIRDFGFEFGVVSESFETSVPWDRLLDLCKNVKERIRTEAKYCGVKCPAFVSCRVTQSYDVGACVYFYFAIRYEGLSDPVHVSEHIESSARDEIMANGGSISHHHGVGKVRKPWLQQTISTTGVEMLRAVKQSIDPQNIFASGNLLSRINNKL